MKILTPVGEKKLYEVKCRLRNFAEWCSNHLLLTIFAAGCWSITPTVFLIADFQRGYDALGGEAFIPVLPFFIWLIEKAIEDDRRN